VSITVKVISGTDDINSNDGLQISPNPLQNGSLTVKVAEDALQLSVFDVAGKLIYENKEHKNEYVIDNHVFESSGVYLIHVTTPKNQINKKVIVTK
jgi:hypothetical protein